MLTLTPEHILITFALEKSKGISNILYKHLKKKNEVCPFSEHQEPHLSKKPHLYH